MIEVLVARSSSGSGAKIWAREPYSGIVCYGKVTGHAGGLAVRRSDTHPEDKKRTGYRTALRLHGVAQMSAEEFREVIGGVSYALLPGKAAVQWDSIVSRVGRFLEERCIAPGYLEGILSGSHPAFDVPLPFDLRFPAEETTPAPAPPGILKAVTHMDAAWDF